MSLLNPFPLQRENKRDQKENKKKKKEVERKSFHWERNSTGGALSLNSSTIEILEFVQGVVVNDLIGIWGDVARVARISHHLHAHVRGDRVKLHSLVFPGPRPSHHRKTTSLTPRGYLQFYCSCKYI